MKEQLEEIRRRALAELSDHATAQAIEAVRVRVLGRSGELTEIMRGIGDLAPDERPLVGKLVNQIKREVESRIAALQDNLRGRELERALGEAKLDVTLPGMKIPRGRIHPITQII
jgi:phenylalanyl-tRNA synthetase alpha chain